MGLAIRCTGNTRQPQPSQCRDSLASCFELAGRRTLRTQARANQRGSRVAGVPEGGLRRVQPEEVPGPGPGEGRGAGVPFTQAPQHLVTPAVQGRLAVSRDQPQGPICSKAQTGVKCLTSLYLNLELAVSSTTQLVFLTCNGGRPAARGPGSQAAHRPEPLRPRAAAGAHAARGIGPWTRAPCRAWMQAAATTKLGPPRQSPTSAKKAPAPGILVLIPPVGAAARLRPGRRQRGPARMLVRRPVPATPATVGLSVPVVCDCSEVGGGMLRGCEGRGPVPARAPARRRSCVGCFLTSIRRTGGEQERVFPRRG